MANILSPAELESVISNFDVEIAEYEIIEMDKYQGWSSVHLYLLVSPSNNYILKAKTADQIAGYGNEVKICHALLENHLPTRQPLLTRNGELFYEQYTYYWCLMTYIPGATSHVNEYSKNTVRSLAKCIDEYVVASNTSESLSKLELIPRTEQKDLDILDRFITELDALRSLGKLDIKDTRDIYLSLKGGYDGNIHNFNTKSLLHNDINPRNILIDHRSKKVISLIDWDHACYGNPLKDVSDAVSIFYDFLPVTTATEYKLIFYQSLKSSWFTQTPPETVEFTFLFYYTVAKWRAILFYLDLLREYDNKYGEKERFIAEISQNYEKWLNIVNPLQVTNV